MMSVASFAYAEGHEMKGADAQAIDTACATDAATANCGTEKVGTGLLKCLHAYKKANESFKFSAGCKAAMQKMHQDHKGSEHGSAAEAPAAH